MTRLQYRLAIRLLLERAVTAADLEAAIGCADVLRTLQARKVPVRHEDGRYRINGGDYARWADRRDVRTVRGPRPALTAAQVDEAVALYGSGATTHEVAERLSVTSRTIVKHLKRVGVERRAGRGGRGRQLTDAELSELRRLYSTGEFTQTALAERFGISGSYVSKLVRDLNDSPSRKGPSPAISGEQLVALKARYLAGEGSSALANSYGVNGATILNTLRRAGVTIRPRGGQRKAETKKTRDR